MKKRNARDHNTKNPDPLVPFSTEIPLSTKEVLIATGKAESRTLAGQGRYVLNRFAQDNRIAKAE